MIQDRQDGGADPVIELINDPQKPDNSDIQDILFKRARELAVQVKEDRNDETGREVLEFLLSGERYAIDMVYIREVASIREITQLPGTPSFILGIISIRGSIISLVDLRIVLGLPPKGLTDYNRVIILQGEKMTFGVLADAIIMTRTIRMDEISRPPPTIRDLGAAYLIGVLPGPLMVIDAETMLNDPKMVISED